jgi:heme exporter protein D
MANLLTSLGPHASFIVTAYAIVGAVVVALIASVIADHRRQRRILKGLEAQGMTRRSQSEQA